MLKRIGIGILFFATAGLLAAAASSVVVVYNSDHADSRELAHFYAERRGIPERNLIGLATAEDLTIDRSTYTATLHNPLLRELKKRGLVAMDMGDETDSIGRLRPALRENRVRYLVTVYGIPAHIANEPELDDAALRQSWFQGEAPSDQFDSGGLARNEAAVDSELALLLHADAPLSGFIPNPYFRQLDSREQQDILRVSRLDGPSPRHVRQMIKGALRVEQRGLKGRAYVDLDQRDGAYTEGNEWLRRSAQVFGQLGYDTAVDEAAEVFQLSDRFDAPALYAGWYAHNLSGVFELPGFRFAPGAIAVHVHSFSAQNLRQDQRNWSGPLIARGASATLGNTAEPFLSLSHHLHLFFSALAQGHNLGDAAYLAKPALSWQSIVIGDPLYEPFKVDLQTQLRQLGDSDERFYDPYVVLRAMNRARANDRPQQALALGRRFFQQTPGLALALELARMQEAEGDPSAAHQTLGFAPHLQFIRSQHWMLMAEIAEFLHDAGDSRSALSIVETLLEDKRLPDELEHKLRRQSIRYAGERESTHPQPESLIVEP